MPLVPLATGGLVPLPKTGRKAGFSAAIKPSGLIASTVPGRTDRHAMKVKPNSYVIPADVVSGLGQGNTMAGAKIFYDLLKAGPYGAGGVKKPRARMPSVMRRKSVSFADGGETEDKTEILAAGGEVVLSPEQVAAIGQGDMQRGHSILDAMVEKVRAQTIDFLSTLPGPQR